MTAPFIYQRDLLIYAVANELSGSGGANVPSLTDLSGNGRHLTASSSYPVITASAVNGKKAVTWDGSKNPLKYTGELTISAGWLVVKCIGTFASGTRGILTGLTANPILVGAGSNGYFVDYKYPRYEYRVSDRIFSPAETFTNGQYSESLTAIAPIDIYAIVFFRFFTPITVDGVQLGQNLTNTGTKANFSLALMALYGPQRFFSEDQIRLQTQLFAYEYQLGIYDVFPFYHSKLDTTSRGKDILADDGDEPITRIKRPDRSEFDLTFGARSQQEMKTAKAFHAVFCPSKRFFIRTYDTIPPQNTACRFPPDSTFDWSGGNNLFNYGFSVVESTVFPDLAIPAILPVIPDEIPPSVLIYALESAPSGYEETLDLTGSAGDNVGVSSFQFLLDGNPIGPTLSSGPYELLWDSRTVANGTHTWSARAWDAAGNNSYSSNQQTIVINNLTNFATAAMGATVTATSSAGAGYPASAVINGLRHTNNAWGSGGGWKSAAAASGKNPEGVTIDLGQQRNISRINVFTLKDSQNYNTDPALSDTFTLYGNIGFTVEYWDGSAWVQIFATLTANDLVWKKITSFSGKTSKIRVLVNSAAASNATLVEVEVLG